MARHFVPWFVAAVDAGYKERLRAQDVVEDALLWGEEAVRMVLNSEENSQKIARLRGIWQGFGGSTGLPCPLLVILDFDRTITTADRFDCCVARFLYASDGDAARRRMACWKWRQNSR